MNRHKPLNKVLPSYKGNCDCVFVPEMPMTEMLYQIERGSCNKGYRITTVQCSYQSWIWKA